MFTDAFGYGNTITCEVDGFEVIATVHHDETMGTPWEEHDGHGPVTDWTRRDKAAGEYILCSDRGSHRFYDFAEAVRIARKEWIGPGPKPRQRAAEAAEADFKRLKAWCEDQWHWVGVVVTVSLDGVPLTGPFDHALWGIESNAGDYLREVANELLGEALEAARERLRSICTKASSAA